VGLLGRLERRDRRGDVTDDPRAIRMVSPLPPAHTGVADYVANILPELENSFRVEIASTREDFEALEGKEGIWIHQLANNPEHLLAYEAAQRHPGLAVLHDLTLSYLVHSYTLGRGEEEALYAEVKRIYGPAKATWLRGELALGRSHSLWSLRFLEEILPKALAVMVHSRFAEATLRRIGQRGRICQAPMPFDPLLDKVSATQSEARHRLGLPEEGFLVGTYGFLGPHKRMEIGVPAFAELRRILPDSRLLIAGEIHDHYADTFDALIEPVREWVHLAGRLSNQDWYLSLLAADVCLNLRYPTIGESSAVLSTVLAAGLPCLVSDLGSYAEFPAGVVAPVPVGEGELEEVTALLARFALDEPFRASMSHHAREYARAQLSPQACASAYGSVLRELCSDL